jgi:pimeloyl-ACP methyl ester carboxylesterase
MIPPVKRPTLGTSVTIAGTLLTLVGLNAYFSARATRRHPPKGAFIEVRGTNIHYFVMGDGPPLVILHGNGSMAADFLASDLVTILATSHKVFVFDRPGYGHSDGGIKWWTASRQARLLDGALNRLGVSGEIIVGHSWGTLVALALSQLRSCKGLVLLSGYYFASPRLDVLAGAISALPGVGDAWRWTFGPVAGWLFSVPALKYVFSPSAIPARFKARFPLALSLRPKALKSSGVESLLMLPTAYVLSKAYTPSNLPIAIVAGQDDKIVSPTQAERLSKTLPNSTLLLVAGAGHMLHQTHATEVLSAVKGLEPAIATQ